MTDVLTDGICDCGALYVMTSTEFVSYRKQREEEGAPVEKRNADTMDIEGGGHQSWSCPFCGKDETTRPTTRDDLDVIQMKIEAVLLATMSLSQSIQNLGGAIAKLAEDVAKYKEKRS